jgi:membrane protein YqaA with SNARE-associated domain
MTGAPASGDTVDRIGAFAGSRGAEALIAIWAAAEAIVLPIVPDVALDLFALAAPRRTARLFALLIAGAIAGSLVLAALTAANPDAADSLLRAVPGIRAEQIAAAQASIATDGVLGFAQFGPGPPLKVYTVAWVEAGGGVPGLVAGVILNRLTRIGPVVLLAAIAGLVAGGWLRRHERLCLAAYALAWVAVYATYLL